MKKNLKFNIPIAGCLLMALFALLIGGCGGGSNGGGGSSPVSSSTKATATGRASVTIKWPARTTKTGRLVPVASNSIVLTISYNGSNVVTPQVIPRPADGSASTFTFPSLPVGQLTVTAAAYPNADGTGTAQASATGVLPVVSNQTATLSITMDSTINSLVISPSSIGTLAIGGSPVAVSVEALSAPPTSAMVLVSAQTIFWFTDNPAVLNVTQDTNDTGATVVGVASGDANLYVYELESGVYTSIPVSVRGPLSTIQITAINPQLSMGAYMQLSIIATDSAGNSISSPSGLTWSSSNSQVVAVAASSGLCAGVVGTSTTAQTAVITVSAQGVTAMTTVTLNAGNGVGPFLSPSVVTLNRNTSQKFLVNTGTTIAQNVTWSLTDPNNLGSAQGNIDGSGLYTAPATPPLVNGVPVQITVQAVSSGTTLTAKVSIQ